MKADGTQYCHKIGGKTVTIEHLVLFLVYSASSTSVNDDQRYPGQRKTEKCAFFKDSPKGWNSTFFPFYNLSLSTKLLPQKLSKGELGTFLLPRWWGNNVYGFIYWCEYSQTPWCHSCLPGMGYCVHPPTNTFRVESSQPIYLSTRCRKGPVSNSHCQQ